MTAKHRTIARRARAPKANKLYQLRTEKGLTLEDVFRATGATQGAVHRWEHGQGEPNIRYRVKYANCLRITVSELGGIVYDQ
jgi:transcriptional regulator with XRE-family HTH domain